MWELSVSACALCERQKNVHLRNLYASKAAAVSSCKLCPVLTGNSTQSLRSTPSWLFYLKTRETLCTHILVQCRVQNVCEANYQNKVTIKWTTGSFGGGIPQVYSQWYNALQWSTLFSWLLYFNTNPYNATMWWVPFYQMETDFSYVSNISTLQQFVCPLLLW